MKTAVVRTWLVYFFTFLLVAALNADRVASWYAGKGDGRDEIQGWLARLKELHTESGFGPWLIAMECAAGPAFEGSYKDKSKCRGTAGNPTRVAMEPEAQLPAFSLEVSRMETQPDGNIPWVSPAESPAPTALMSEAVVADERDEATRSQPTMPSPGAAVTREAAEVGLESYASAADQIGIDGWPTRDAAQVEAAAEVARSPGLLWALLFPDLDQGEGCIVTPGVLLPESPPVMSSDVETASLALAPGPFPVGSRDRIEEGRAPAGQAPENKQRDPASERTDFQSVLLVGDSLAHGLALSLGRELKDRKGAVFSFVSKVSSGLNNPNLFNWEKTMRMLVENGAPDLVLIMMGVNDANNHIRDGNRLCLVGTPEWGQAYESRVEHFLRIASENASRVCWIGVPVVREEWLQNRVVLANMAARNACGRVENCRFIDTFEALCDENRRYTNYVKEPGGSCVRIRTKDGIHFSMEGSNLLSSYILQKL